LIPIAKPYLTEDEANEAAKTVLSGWVAQGPRVKEFEERFAEYVGSKYAVAVSNCTVALHLCMIVSDIAPGDEVICPSMSYIATANAIRYAGAKPVFAEVLPDDFNLDPLDVERKITPKTKAILLAHQIGNPADIDSLRAIADAHDIRLIEDAACAIGCSYKGKKIGSHSDLVCFSFHPRKVITTGEGGMITTSDEELCNRLRLLRQHAISASSFDRHADAYSRSEDHVELGYNYRLTDIQAAIGIKQLEKLDFIVGERNRIAKEYKRHLSNIKWIRLPVEKADRTYNYQSFAITLSDDSPINRDELMKMLAESGISTRKGIMTAHRETAYRGFAKEADLPVSEKASDTSFLIPLFVPMKEEEILTVVSALRRIFENK
jgi:dTDP-4-amino-4,6-dideoxygalactose transaminase